MDGKIRLRYRRTSRRILLSVVGFDAENVTESSITGMRMFYTLLPIAGVIGAILIMKNYDITEEKAAQIKKELSAKKGE